MIRRAVALLSVATAVPLAAEIWSVQKVALPPTEIMPDWWVACSASLDEDHSGWTRMVIVASSTTAVMRERAGDPEIWAPFVWLAADPTGGVSRDGSPIGSAYVEDRTAQGGKNRYIDGNYKEHRFRWRLNEGPRHDAWVPVEQVAVYDEEGVFDPRRSTAWIFWRDFPAEMFATNDTTTLRLAFPGLTRGKGVDYLRRTRVRLTYSHGLEAMEDVERCIEDHRKAGRAVTTRRDDLLTSPFRVLPRILR